MQLSEADNDHFYRLMRPLRFYAAARSGLLPASTSLPEPTAHPPLAV